MPRWLSEETTSTISSRKKINSNRAEEEAAKKLGGTRTAKSGARYYAGGVHKHRLETEGKDGETPDFVFEHKRIDPETKSMRLDRKWLKQIAETARRAGKEPALVLRFDRNHVGGVLEEEFVKGSQAVPEEWLMLPIDVAARLLGVSVKSSR